ncbi:hypothetical protein Taro_049374 [Colocasia esculenta]|uniref:Uncharacterized protein n=1 Tax=Colocasia esculenta TaxID=4460 RepID=A0A843XAT1_COLES|nr:hypothetical protein [Colocasia esculenta]
MGVPPDVPYNGRQTYVEGRRLGSVVAQASGQENSSKDTNIESTILASSTIHNKLPMGVPPVVPYNGRRTYVEGRRLGSVVAQASGQENSSKDTNIESTILASSTIHNKLPMGVPPGVRHNGVQMDGHENREKNFSIQFDGQQIHVEERRFGSLATQGNVPMNERCFPTSTPTNHNFGEANCQVFMSNETLEAINRAETELEFTLADLSRESDRQVHLSREVLEAYSEEMNNSNTNSTTTTFPSNYTLRKTRGPTQETAVTPPKGQRWKCLIIDGQPVGQAACKLAIILGLYARMEGYFPPYKQWKEQSPQSFKDVMKDIMRDYDFVDIEGMQANMAIVTHFCYESLKKKVRDWRFWLKTHYYIDVVPDEVVMKAPDKRVTQKNWELLLKYWERDDKILEAERNKRNRGEDRATHTLGAKSIARHNHDEREKLGDDYTSLGAYLKAHQTKNGDYPNDYTQAMCEKVRLTCVERDITNSSDPCILSPILDIVYKGHHGGYERGRGLGWSRAVPWSKLEATASNSNESVQHLTHELQNARAEIEAMHEREKEMEARERDMQTRLERMEALLSMHFSDGSVGGNLSHGETSHSHLPR